MLRGANLTLLMGPTIPTPVPPHVLDLLASAQVTTSANERSGFQLTFHYGKSSLVANALIPAGYFDPGIRVIIVATVGFVPTVIMDGFITRQDVIPSSEPGKTALTVTGEDLAVAMDYEDKTGEKHVGLASSGRALTILSKYGHMGIVPEVIPSPFEEPTSPTDKTFAQKGTDYAYVKKMAEDLGYVFYIEPGYLPGHNKAYWGPEKRLSAQFPQSALNVNLDGDTNVESISFGYNGLHGANQIATIQERITKIDIPVPVPDVQLLSPPLALKPPKRLKTTKVHDTANLTPIAAIAKLLGAAKDAADAVTGSGSLDVLRYGGILGARRLVGVRGAGLAYDGVYYVKSVTHNIKPGGYKQSFTLARNGLIPFGAQVAP